MGVVDLSKLTGGGGTTPQFSKRGESVDQTSGRDAEGCTASELQNSLLLPALTGSKHNDDGGQVHDLKSA